jgi:hypothetical protein
MGEEGCSVREDRILTGGSVRKTEALLGSNLQHTWRKMNKTFSMSRLVAIVAGLALAGTASASVIAGGSFGITTLDPISYVGPWLADASSISFGGAVLVGARTGDFDCGVHPGPDCILGGSTVSFANPIDPAFPVFPAPLMTFNGQGGSVGRFTFTPTSATVSSTGQDDLTIYLLGTFADADGAYDTNAASVIMNLTQSGGPGNTVSFAGTFSTPPTAPSTNTPEPISLILFGSGLVGMGLLRRSRRA